VGRARGRDVQRSHHRLARFGNQSRRMVPVARNRRRIARPTRRAHRQRRWKSAIRRVRDFPRERRGHAHGVCKRRTRLRVRLRERRIVRRCSGTRRSNPGRVRGIHDVRRSKRHVVRVPERHEHGCGERCRRGVSSPERRSDDDASRAQRISKIHGDSRRRSWRHARKHAQSTRIHRVRRHILSAANRTAFTGIAKLTPSGSRLPAPAYGTTFMPTIRPFPSHSAPPLVNSVIFASI